MTGPRWSDGNPVLPKRCMVRSQASRLFNPPSRITCSATDLCLRSWSRKAPALTPNTWARRRKWSSAQSLSRNCLSAFKEKICIELINCGWETLFATLQWQACSKTAFFPGSGWGRHRQPPQTSGQHSAKKCTRTFARWGSECAGYTRFARLPCVGTTLWSGRWRPWLACWFLPHRESHGPSPLPATVPHLQHLPAMPVAPAAPESGLQGTAAPTALPCLSSFFRPSSGTSSEKLASRAAFCPVALKQIRTCALLPSGSGLCPQSLQCLCWPTVLWHSVRTNTWSLRCCWSPEPCCLFPSNGSPSAAPRRHLRHTVSSRPGEMNGPCHDQPSSGWGEGPSHRRPRFRPTSCRHW